MGGKKGDYQLISPNNDVNMAQSTNDVNELSSLEEGLGQKAAECKDVLKMGRTHLQDAVPISLGQEFEAYANAIKRSKVRITTAMQNLYKINMGATAVGTGLNAEPEYINEVVCQISLLTGEQFASAPNLVDVTQNTAELAEMSGVLKICALALSKIANDLRLMASGPKCGFNEINLPPVQPGSSIMPGKVNYVIPEMINQVAFQVIGNDHVISLAVEAGQFDKRNNYWKGTSSQRAA